MNLTDMSVIRSLMEEFGLSSAKKKYGQNFLTNKSTVERIASAGVESSSDGVIEIGPGMGTMTRELCDIAKKVVALEIDSDLMPLLDKTLADKDNVKVINKDCMKTDLEALIKEEFEGFDTVRVCANLPYYITTPILMMLIECNAPIKSITVMIQKEVADRLCGDASAEDYGAISASIAYRGKATKLFNVSPGCFYPAPKVDSSVVRIDIYDKKPIEARDEKILKRVIRGAFAQRRKTLVNSLSSEFSEFSKAELTTMITALGYDERIRGEKLNIEDFVTIADKIFNCKNS